MTDRAQALLREALALPIDERADVAAELLASLDGTETGDAEVEAAWASEIERRARRVLAGDSSSIPWEDVRRRAEADLRKSSTHAFDSKTKPKLSTVRLDDGMRTGERDSASSFSTPSTRRSITS